MYGILSLYNRLLIDVMMDGWILVFWYRYLIHASLVKLARREGKGAGEILWEKARTYGIRVQYAKNNKGGST